MVAIKGEKEAKRQKGERRGRERKESLVELFPRAALDGLAVEGDGDLELTRVRETIADEVGAVTDVLDVDVVAREFSL